MMDGEGTRPDEELQFITVPESSIPSGLPSQYVPPRPGGGPAVGEDHLGFMKQTRVSFVT